MTRNDAVPTINRSAVLLVVVGALGILSNSAAALHLLPTVFTAAVTFLLLPILLVIAGIPLGVGSSRLRSVVGPSIIGRVLFVAWAVLTAGSQLAFLAELTDDTRILDSAETVRQVLSLLAAATGILAGVIILNSGPRTLGRGSLIFGVVLFAMSESLFFAQTPVIGVWWGVPLALGQLLIGVSYLHSGLSDVAPVPERPESLAE